jgi:hypothetical protein
MASYSVLFRFAGYAMLLLTLFDIINAFIPPQFGNSAWEFQTTGGLVERSIVPIMGFILAFYDNQEARSEKEMLLLKALSWISLLTGIFYLGLLVLVFITPSKIDDINQNSINARLNPEITKLHQMQVQVEKASTTQLETIMKSDKAVTTTDPQVFRSKVLENMATTEKNLKAEANATRDSQRLSLLKSAVKWGLGALVSAVVFMRIWAVTYWARDY